MCVVILIISHSVIHYSLSVNDINFDFRGNKEPVDNFFFSLRTAVTGFLDLDKKNNWQKVSE